MLVQQYCIRLTGSVTAKNGTLCKRQEILPYSSFLGGSELILMHFLDIYLCKWRAALQSRLCCCCVAAFSGLGTCWRIYASTRLACTPLRCCKKAGQSFSSSHATRVVCVHCPSRLPWVLFCIAYAKEFQVLDWQIRHFEAKSWPI